MNQLSITKMSSREIAKLTGKQHAHVCRDISKLNNNYENMGMPKVGYTPYVNPQNKQSYKEYNLTKMQTLDLITGYNISLRIAVNRRWEELELKTNSIDFSNPDTVAMIAQNWADSERKRKEAENQLQIQQPKVEYCDKVLKSTSTYTTTQIAKELGMSGTKLNRKLHEMEVQYKQSGTWLLYQKYQDKGYTKTRTHDYISNGEQKTSMQTVWTEKGRFYIHSLFGSDLSKVA